MSKFVVRVTFLTDSWCEYCPKIPKKTYLPIGKSVLNPARICEECVKDYEIVDWVDSWEDYRKISLTFKLE